MVDRLPRNAAAMDGFDWSAVAVAVAVMVVADAVGSGVSCCHFVLSHEGRVRALG